MRVSACADLKARRFMVIPTRHEPMHWRVKRWFPNYNFKKLIETTARMQRG